VPSIKLDPTLDGTVLYQNITDDRGGSEGYYLYTTSNVLTCAKTISGNITNIYRSFLDFDTSGLRTTLQYKALFLCFYVKYTTSTFSLSVTDLDQPAGEYADYSLLFDDIAASDYITYDSTVGQHIVNLGAQALADFLSHPTWVSVGMRVQNEGQIHVAYIRSSEDTTPAYRPYLILYTGSAPIAYDGGGSMRF